MIPTEGQPNYTHDLIALIAEYAKRGVNVCPIILDTMMTVPDDAVDPGQAAVWYKMRDMAAEGKPPNVLALKRAVAGVPPSYWAELRSEESSIKDVRDALLKEAQMRRYQTFAGSLPSLLASSTIAQINGIMGSLMDESVAGTPEATQLSSISYMDRINRLKAGTLPMIKTPWHDLNKILGGGFFMGGDRAMTAILAYSSVGKTRFAQQVNIQAGQDGHWTVVFAGESNAESYKLGMAQPLAYVPQWAMNPVSMTAEHMKRLEDQEPVINGLNTYVFDKGFNVNLIRAVISRISRELKEAKTAGRAAPGAQLLVIVDNIDHAIEGGGNKEWQELEQAAKGLYNTAQRLECHIIILAQAKLGGFYLGHPPGLADFARANLIASHCANIIGLYRPVTYEQLNAPVNDPRLVAKVSVPKARGANPGTFYPHIDTEYGLWA